MSKKIFGFIIGFVIMSAVVFLPFLAFNTVSAAWSPGDPLVPSCGKVVPSLDGKTGLMTNPCNFDYFMLLINNVITFLLFYFATPLAAIALCYAGALLLFSGGNSEKMTKAKHIIKNVLIGYLLALAAWLIIKTIFSTLGFKGETYLVS